MDRILFGDDEHTKTNPGAPSTRVAWEHFYKATLPRKERREDGTFRKLEPGETGGELYDVFWTPVVELGDFGLGVGMYFTTLLALAAMIFLCAIFNSAAIYHYRSDSYNHPTSYADTSLEGSAVCEPTSVPTDSNYTTSVDVNIGCNMNKQQGGAAVFIVLILVIFLVVLSWYQNKIAEAIDESEQTAQDYSICVADPDPTDNDPDAWKEFFERVTGSHVTYVTVALDNGALLTALAKRREIVAEIERDSNVNFNDPDGSDTAPLAEANVPLWKAKAQKLGLFRNLDYWKKELAEINTKIQDLAQKEYHVAQVYVVFETEAGQRAALEKLTVGIIPAMLEKSTKITDDLKFKGTNVLNVTEAAEPTDVIWHNLEVPLKTQIIQQTVTFLTGFAIICVFAGIIQGLQAVSATAAALFISFGNTLLPIIMKMLNKFEQHKTTSSMQNSLLLKLVVARWVNTAFIIYFVTSYDERLSYAKIKNIMAILWADAFTSPILRVLDLGGMFNKYILAPLAKTQNRMNSYFGGTSWFLAERYTDMSKTVFVSLFFAVILPQGLFITVIALFVNFWVDKYCLLRIWKPAPPLDDRLARASRGHFALTILIHVTLTLHFFAGFPFNGYCQSSTKISSSVNTTGLISEQQYVWEKCDESPNGVFSVTSNADYNAAQKLYVPIFNVLSVMFLVLFLVVYFGKECAYSFLRLFRGVYKSQGSDMNIFYSSVKEIQTYVPEISTPKLSKPLLACDISEINHEHISWTETKVGEYAENNIMSPGDVIGFNDEQLQKIFSFVKYYPAPVTENRTPITNTTQMAIAAEANSVV